MHGLHMHDAPPAPSAVEILELADWAEARGRAGRAWSARKYVKDAAEMLARGAGGTARLLLIEAAEVLS